MRLTSMVQPTLVISLLTMFPSVEAVAQPRVLKGDVQSTAANGPLSRGSIEALAARSGVTWIGYAVPAVAGEHRMCCWNTASAAGSCCQACRLESPGATTFGQSSGPGIARLEAAATLHVLYRVVDGRVERIRMFSEECALDAGGLTIRWLTGVNGTDSAALLATFLSATEPRNVVDGALGALAMHQEAAALERLLAAARQGPTTHIRGQALFWLSQRAGDRAVGAISEAIARDPETEVQTRAVFALSQLPKNEGVPLLIQVARNNGNPAVKKQAIFWLGQSRDPRALQFFEEILFKPSR
jgi:hypothetical protein